MSLTRKEVLKSWLERRKDRWISFKKLIGRKAAGDNYSLDEALAFIKDYQALNGDLSLARTILPGSQVSHILEALLKKASTILYKEPHDTWKKLHYLYKVEIAGIVKQMQSKIIIVTSLFLAFGISAWLLIKTYPELVGLVASQQMIDGVQAGKLWTDDILNIMPSSIIAFNIIANNVTVTLFAFTVGVFYGLGTLYIIGLNGFMLGAVFAFTDQYGMADRLLAFVFAHGVVELSVICLAGAAGIYLGEALARPGERPRLIAFQEAVNIAGKLLAVCIPFLIIAGIIEGYISPNDSYSMNSRIVIGLGFELLFILVLTGRFWGQQYRE